jgi:DNA-binding CsgD family transcriptional regulator/tetratricopeptide (TPR) repeat protein
VDVALYGRDLELEAGRAFLAPGPALALLIEGPAGVGKTTVWRALCEVARVEGYLVLQVIGDPAEARLTFAGLADLLGMVADETLPRLPAPQARALEVALLRAEAAIPSEPRAVAAGVLGALRALAERQQVLVAIDDIQWLDGASADAITFAARRLDGERARFLLTRRPRAPTQLERALAPGLTRLRMGPLSLGAMRRMLADRLELTLPQHLLLRIFDATLGNPLFALELGRTLAEEGLPALGDDLPLPQTVAELLGARVTRLPRPVRRLLLALALSGDLDRSRLPSIAGPATLDNAIERGLVLVDGNRVRASHPLLAAAVKKRSGGRERRELHLTLADAAADDGLRAHHLALASRDPDEQLAATVAAAAGRAFTRGARREAAELGEHAIRLTPAGSASRPERLLALASYLETAGELDRLKDLLTANLDTIPSGLLRARAWLLLAEVAYEHVDDYREHLERARVEAEADPALHALVVAKMSSAVISVERIADAEKRALAVLPAAERAGHEVERAVLFALAWARGLSGHALDDICERWNAASATPGHLGESPERVAGQRYVWRGEIGKARPVLDRLLALSDERGEIGSYVWARLHLCELALRTGDWQTAQRLLDEWAETAERELFVEPYYQRCRALLAVGRGLAEEAVRWSTDTIDRAKAIGFQWDWLEALRARGLAGLLRGEPAGAAESLGTVWDHTVREGVDEPGVFPVAPELVEALVELGELDRALAVTSRLRMLAGQQQHPWGLVTAQRCGALIRLATPPDDAAAAAELAAAADRYGELGLRFDRARTLLALGKAQRRLRRWGAARRALEGAAGAFDEIGSPGWATLARTEAGRVSARRPGTAGELTPTERRVAELAATGRSNKEIARALFISINTVEGHLSHAYAKLGIRSRAQLAHRLAGAIRPGSAPRP